METWENLSKKLVKELMIKQEKEILAQLKGFVDQGLMEIEATEPQLIKKHNDEGGLEIELVQAIGLRLKEQDRINFLVNENLELKRKLNLIKGALSEDS